MKPKTAIIDAPPWFIIALRDPKRNVHIEMTRRHDLPSARAAAREFGERYRIDKEGRLVDLKRGTDGPADHDGTH